MSSDWLPGRLTRPSGSGIGRQGHRLALLLKLEGHTSTVFAVDVSPDGRTIASGSLDNTVRIWDAETDESLHTLKPGHSGAVWSVHISPDTRRVASGSDDQTSLVSDIKTGELAFEPIKCNGDVFCVRYSPSGDRIASASGVIQIWNADTAKHILSIEEPGLYSLAWSLDGEQIIGGGHEHITIFNSSTGDQICTWKAHGGFIRFLSLSPNGSHMATCDSLKKTAFVFDVTTGEKIAAYEHGGDVWGIAHSPSGRFIGIACEDRKAYLWDAPDDPQTTVSFCLVLVQFYSHTMY
ncbi:hypothetical protein HYDPIDRAFT_111289 [Hydnomerulius pinastri MD-312]|uniref:WD40 repeat-like protein n=1 Tax=Hydnomerulius pinastri MD-312 TaxID=994086 RepID=A0A0C9WFD7_9AGAM|nr:hypothetical protein HYDPIDRAFT_111289 [Hydnomerulius pinastri MD-312]